MERNEIKDFVLTELLQRSYQLMRENDPEIEKAIVAYTEIAERMDKSIRECGLETRQVYEEYRQSVSDTHSMEVEHAYVQGTRDCICLLRFLDML